MKNYEIHVTRTIKSWMNLDPKYSTVYKIINFVSIYLLVFNTYLEKVYENVIIWWKIDIK